MDYYATLSDEVHLNHMSGKAEESKQAVTLDVLDSMVNRHLKMDMKDNSATSRMQTLFESYVTILRRNSLKWWIESNQMVSVSHFLSGIKPMSLQACLTSDLAFAHHELNKDFKKFSKHVIKLSDAF